MDLFPKAALPRPEAEKFCPVYPYNLPLKCIQTYLFVILIKRWARNRRRYIALPLITSPNLRVILISIQCFVVFSKESFLGTFPQYRATLTSWSNCSFSAFISEVDTVHICRVLSIPSDPFQELQHYFLMIEGALEALEVSDIEWKISTRGKKKGYCLIGWQDTRWTIQSNRCLFLAARSLVFGMFRWHQS